MKLMPLFKRQPKEQDEATGKFAAPAAPAVVEIAQTEVE